MKDESQKYLCSSKNINGNILDEKIIENINSLPESKSAFIDELSKSVSLFPSDEFNIDVSYQKQIEKNNTKIKRLLETLIDTQNKNVKLEIEKEIDDLNIRNKEIKSEIEILQSKNINSSFENIDLIIQNLLNFESAFKCSSLTGKRNVIKTLIKNVTWCDDFAQVTYNI